MFKWTKLGKVFNPSEAKTADWMQEYAQLPSPLIISEDVIRVYFATRPQRDAELQYVSRSGYVDLDRSDLTKVLHISHKPVLELGDIGSFDEFGSMTSSFVKFEEKIYAYYTGWTRLQSVPYTMAIGLGISSDGGKSFSKIGNGPIMSSSFNEPYVISGPVVKIIDGKWYMWYLFGTKWIDSNGKKEPIYKLAHATSEDGINWQRNGQQIIPSAVEDECQVSFGIFQENNKWHTIFAYRPATDFRKNSERSYRLGYASSTDLSTWNRDDSQVGIDISENGWDSEMICYPQVCEIDDKYVLFYCGNKFGCYGFGAAVLERIYA